MTHREAFVEAARAAQSLLAHPEVAERWSRPSACEGFTVGGLAAHLATQVLKVPDVLAGESKGDEPKTLLGHYASVAWAGADLESDINVGIRDGGEALAADGAQALAGQVADVTDKLSALLAAQPVDRVVELPWVGWSLALDDYLTTRMMEIAVHRDDLAVSVGLEVDDLPEAVFGPVLDLLADLAARRHGQTAVLRALARAERAPDRINAL
ncbi:maleylpyruvate isomerase N-terminal domain-containing protein [Oryzihumus sp.]